MPSVSARIAAEITAVSTSPVIEKQVIAAVALLDEGSTVPFISRYRKEVTGGLDDNQLRLLEERLRYIRELDERRVVIIKTIEEQGKLTPQLQQELTQADTKTRLEDLYLPYKVKRRTKAQIAKEAGLEPLAELLLQQPETDTASAAGNYLNDTITDIKSALDGAKQILMERFAEDADLLGRLREYLWQEGHVFSAVAKDKEQEGAKFRDYFEFDEALQKIPSHRALALFRGRNEGILQIRMDIPDRDETVLTHPAELMVAKHWQVDLNSSWLKEVIRWTWRVKLATHLETELLAKIRERAEEEAIKVFSDNLKDLLLAAPAGQKATLGLDPGLRTGVKVAVVDNTGQHVADTAIFPHAPRNDWDGSLHTLAKLCQQHKIELISIGNGTASRETDKLAGDLMKRHPELKLTKIITSEAGASVYSASELAAKEFPDLDVTVRGAISIARRLQDPLAELVKIEPKAIGVGQYQHDVSQTQLARSLEAAVEDCVNAVGVDLNTASSALLLRVAGLNQTIANNIVEFRNQNGAFSNRKQLKSVTRLGEKTFEQAAGFLRISNGDNPLDASAVHPEAYRIVDAIAKKNNKPVTNIIGDSRFLKSLTAANYVTDEFGAPTITDIIKELDKPGRDPRPEFKVAAFAEGVEKIQDLELDMILEGTVTNVTNFGAFVDIGVHQDGLVHISCLSNEFVKDPREVVRAGDIVKVKVLEVDIPRKRIGMSMRLSDSSKDREDNDSNKNTRPTRQTSHKRPPEKQPPAGGGSMAAAFASAKRK